MPEIEGPLGIWPWPLLNTIIAVAGDGDESAEITEVNRDENGRVTSIETFKK